MGLLRGYSLNILRFLPLTRIYLTFSCCRQVKLAVDTQSRKAHISTVTHSKHVLSTFVTLLCLHIFCCVWRKFITGWHQQLCEAAVVTDELKLQKVRLENDRWAGPLAPARVFVLHDYMRVIDQRFFIRGTRRVMCPSDHAFSRGRAIFIDVAWADWRLAQRLWGLSMHSLFLPLAHWFVCSWFFFLSIHW